MHYESGVSQEAKVYLLLLPDLPENALFTERESVSLRATFYAS